MLRSLTRRAIKGHQDGIRQVKDTVSSALPGEISREVGVVLLTLSY